MATIPKNAKQPADRKTPAARRKSEAAAEQFYEATAGGVTFRVCHPDDWFLQARDALTNNDLRSWAREGGVHPDDLDAFLGARIRNKEMSDEMAAAFEYFGADEGE